MCRIDTGLARKADTWYSGCTKKVMFQKHTGTAILLKWLTTVTVHEGAMSFIHYRTLRANPLFRVFRVSCIRHVWYNRFLFGWVLGLVRKEGRIQQRSILHPNSATPPISGKCLVAAGRVVTQYCNRVHSRLKSWRDSMPLSWSNRGCYSPSSLH